MVAFELGEGAITLLDVKKTPWQGKLNWNWFNCSVENAPIGEFKARVPASWLPRPDLSPVDFILTANSYFEKGRISNDEINLVNYHRGWPAIFEEMANWLRSNIPPEIILRIEHIGSTAIPGMPAKPIIDILLEVPSFDEARRVLIPVFNKPESEYWWYDDHITFIMRKELMGTRTHHIHVAPQGQFSERIIFRDYLRTHPYDANRYAALKRELAARHAADREEYTAAKGSFIREITEKALKEK